MHNFRQIQDVSMMSRLQDGMYWIRANIYANGKSVITRFTEISGYRYLTRSQQRQTYSSHFAFQRDIVRIIDRNGSLSE